MKQDNKNEKEIDAKTLKFVLYLKAKALKLGKDPNKYVAELKESGLLEKEYQNFIKKAEKGTKLNYFKSLKNQCAEDEELYYYKKGGSVDCGCRKKEEGGIVTKAKDGSVVDKFKSIYKKATESVKSGIQKEINNKKQGRYINVSKKLVEEAKKLNKDNSKLPLDSVVEKCGGKMKKHQNGSVVDKFKAAKCGSKLKKHFQGGTISINWNR